MRTASPSLRHSDHDRTAANAKCDPGIRTDRSPERHTAAASARSKRRAGGVNVAPGPGTYEDAEAALRCSRLRSAPAARFGGGCAAADGQRGRRAAASGPRRSFVGDSVSSLELREPARAQDWLGKRALACARWTRPGSAARKHETAARRSGAIQNLWCL